jgi:DNA-binding XRE family transcriptional regulator
MTTICPLFDHHVLVGWRGQSGWVTMPVVVHIGNKLKETRTRELLTQQELAEKSGVGVNTIIRVERNQVEPHFRTIRKLAEALGIDPKALL